MQNISWPSDWMRAALSLCVLKALDGGATYGYAIASGLEEQGFGTVKGGTLYPLLTRFEAAGWVTVSWQAGDGGPGRKYFSLTSAGRRELAEQRELWARFSGTVDRFLGTQGRSTETPDRSTHGNP
ncbi:PadR family transcriptional regulator [Arthrobacter sp. ZGTC212]|uniref:PadR family transcriptional regulator n=1 Tax=Arthrobacter sp. ZGTC212 TaxID=2058899 RepID=UPI0035BE41CC